MLCLNYLIKYVHQILELKQQLLYQLVSNYLCSHLSSKKGKYLLVPASQMQGFAAFIGLFNSKLIGRLNNNANNHDYQTKHVYSGFFIIKKNHQVRLVKPRCKCSIKQVFGYLFVYFFVDEMRSEMLKEVSAI